MRANGFTVKDAEDRLKWKSQCWKMDPDFPRSNVRNNWEKRQDSDNLTNKK